MKIWASYMQVLSAERYQDCQSAVKFLFIAVSHISWGAFPKLLSGILRIAFGCIMQCARNA